MLLRIRERLRNVAPRAEREDRDPRRRARLPRALPIRAADLDSEITSRDWPEVDDL